MDDGVLAEESQNLSDTPTPRLKILVYETAQGRHFYGL